jgi:hypothetical protein
MMPLEPFELRDHRGARIRNSARYEDLDKTRISCGFFGRVVGHSDDQVMRYFSGVLDALSRDPAAMSMA